MRPAAWRRPQPPEVDRREPRSPGRLWLLQKSSQPPTVTTRAVGSEDRRVRRSTRPYTIPTPASAVCHELRSRRQTRRGRRAVRAARLLPPAEWKRTATLPLGSAGDTLPPVAQYRGAGAAAPPDRNVEIEHRQARTPRRGGLLLGSHRAHLVATRERPPKRGLGGSRARRVGPPTRIRALRAACGLLGRCDPASARECLPVVYQRVSRRGSVGVEAPDRTNPRAQRQQSSQSVSFSLLIGGVVQQPLPCQVWWPSLIARAAMASATAGSVHHRPKAALSVRPISTPAAR